MLKAITGFFNSTHKEIELCVDYSFVRRITEYQTFCNIAVGVESKISGLKLIDFNNVKLIDDFRRTDVDHLSVFSLSEKADLKKIYN